METRPSKNTVASSMSKGDSVSESIYLSERFEERRKDDGKVDYQREIINVFYLSMLDIVVDTWTSGSIKGRDKSITIDISMLETADNKDFKNLTDEEVLSISVVDVKGSRVSYLKEKLFGAMKSFKSEESLVNKVMKNKLCYMDSVRSSRVQSMVIEESEELPELEQEEFMDFVNYDDSILSDPFEYNVTIVFKFGGIYKGPTYQKNMHGVGEFFWSDGAYYKGDFEDGNITGQGILLLPDQSKYSGEFCGNWFHGNGTLQMANTTMIYSGGWNAGKKHGEGWLLYKQGNWYDGEWANDKREGKGLRQYQYGVRYKGFWKEDLQHGQGTMLYENNDFYKGEWEAGKPCGQGTYTWKIENNKELIFYDKTIYKGAWHNGQRHGVGVMNFGYGNGSTLAGVWNYNNKHGPGVMMCGNGNIIEMCPLFIDDKPLNIVSERNSAASAFQEGSGRFDKLLSQVFLEQNINISEETDIIHKGFQEDVYKSVIDLANRNSSDHTSPISYDEFKNPADLCNPMEISFLASSQDVITNYIINIMQDKCTGQCRISKFFVPPDKRVLFGPPKKFYCYCPQKYEKLLYGIQICQYKDFEKCGAKDEKEYIAHEGAKLKEMIKKNMRKMKFLYKYYCRIVLPDPLEDDGKNCNLPRLYLWQLLRDLGVFNYNYSLAQCDQLCFINKDTNFESEHDPFEMIYLWQFIQIMLTLSYYFCIWQEPVERGKGESAIATMFYEFIEEFIMPLIEKLKNGKYEHKNGALFLFEYKDLLPIDKVYDLYKSYGEPHTVRHFLNFCCVRKKHEIPCSYRSYPDDGFAIPKTGFNTVFYDFSITFVEDDKPFNQKENIPEEPKDEFFKNLYVFRSLGPRNIIKGIAKICPLVVKEGVIVDMDYPLVFIEFYDIIITLAKMMVEKSVKKANREKKIAEIRLLMEQGLWEPDKPKKVESVTHKKGQKKKK